jgi:hypothetical protein
MMSADLTPDGLVQFEWDRLAGVVKPVGEIHTMSWEDMYYAFSPLLRPRSVGHV